VSERLQRVIGTCLGWAIGMFLYRLVASTPMSETLSHMWFGCCGIVAYALGESLRTRGAQ
jgi:uncharacterized membrane protein YccC